MTTAAIYCRISKDAEGRGLGVERQEHECRALAERLDLEVVDVLVDNDVSASDGRQRPGYERLLARMAAREFGALLCYHPDRLTRSPLELEALIDAIEEAGVAVNTVSAGTYDLATPAGRLGARIVGSTARYEMEQKSMRQRSKNDQLARDGKAPGGRPPYGYRRAPGTYEIEDLPTYMPLGGPPEADIVRRIAAEAIAGRSLLSIARGLNEDGIPTREGRPWHHSTVRSVATNPAVAGLRVHRRVVTGPGNWPAIVSPEIHAEVAARLADPARRRRTPDRRYLLTGLLRTPAGAPLVGRLDKGRPTYATRPGGISKRVGPWVGIDAERLEQIVSEALLARLDDVTLPTPEEPADVAEVARLEAEMAELADLRGRGVISLAEWMAAREPLAARIAEAAAAVHRPHRVDELAVPGAVRERWPDLDIDRRRAILTEVISEITVAPADGRGRWMPVADRLSVTWKV